MRKKNVLEARVEVARDVIAQLEAKAWRAMSGEYCTIFGRGRGRELPKSFERMPIKRALLSNSNRECQACAVGSLFIAHMLRSDGEKKFDDLNGAHSWGFEAVVTREAMERTLRDLFSNSELWEIEHAFEGGEWWKTYRDDTERLIAIMRNVVRNGGVFKPAELRAPEGYAPVPELGSATALQPEEEQGHPDDQPQVEQKAR